jgi:glycosyltransferase involved in cell wall biosynthesis
MRVLVASDDRDFVPLWASGYLATGAEVTTGAYNIKLRGAAYDVVHHQWPEELCGWRLPVPSELDEIREVLQWWGRRATNVLTVNNLLPHGHENAEQARALYSLFYEHCHVITHYSHESLRLVQKEFPASHERLHIVTTPFNYEILLPIQSGWSSCRKEFGLSEDDFVILVFGTLRHWGEIQLICEAFSQARVPRKRLLMAGRFSEPGPRLRQRFRRVYWAAWLRVHRTVVREHYIPEDEIYKYMLSSDVVIVPRLVDLSSGLPGLAMTFGRLVIAPAHGAYPEYLSGSDNLLYESASASGLAKAIEQSALLDRESIGARNRKIAATWSWEKIARKCIDAVAEVSAKRPAVAV